MTQSHSQRVTRSDVAKEAGTSVAVVSYVINNGPRPVAEATRQRVLQAIDSADTSIDQLVARCGLPVQRVLATVSVLETRHLVCRVSGDCVRRRFG